MKVRKQRKRHPVPLRAIAKETGLSLTQVWRIVRRRQQYSKASAEKVASATEKLKQDAKVAQAVQKQH
jgi:hypothetical protein